MIPRTGDRFVKRGNPAALAVEHAKSTCAHALGQESGTFRAPRVLDWDETAGVLEFEQVSSLRPLRELIATEHPEVSRLLGQAGEALAVVHDSLEVPDSMVREYPPQWMDAEEPNVCVHGDFTMNNVGWDDDRDALVIVDWSTSPLIDPFATVASPYFDLHWFVFHLFYGVPLRSRMMPDSRGAADRFIAGYASRRGFSEASFERLRRAQANHYEHEVADSAAIRTAATRLPYSFVQRARYRRWTTYRPSTQG